MRIDMKHYLITNVNYALIFAHVLIDWLSINTFIECRLLQTESLVAEVNQLPVNNNQQMHVVQVSCQNKSRMMCMSVFFLF